MHLNTTEDDLPLEFPEAVIKKAITTLKEYHWVETYCWIMDRYRSETNLSEDGVFQRMYICFYNMRPRDNTWYDRYFSFMEEHKHDSALTFESILRCLYAASGEKRRVDASFSSKLLHTVNTAMPIWDKNVLKALEMKAPKSDPKKKEQQILDSLTTYECLTQRYDAFKGSANANTMVAAFDAAFDKTFSGVHISETKKIDFILWRIGTGVPYYNLGLDYLKRGDYTQAIAEGETCLRLDPKNTKAKKLIEMAQRERGTL